MTATDTATPTNTRTITDTPTETPDTDNRKRADLAVFCSVSMGTGKVFQPRVLE